MIRTEIATTPMPNTEQTTPFIPAFIPEVKTEYLEMNHNHDNLKLETQEQKSTLLTCIIVALVGLMIILVTSILLLLRR
jgi:type IV secretory pathway component VirB8